MTELIDKLRAALDEDERVAREVGDATWNVEPWEGDAPAGYRDGAWVRNTETQTAIAAFTKVYPETAIRLCAATHIARHDPARVLRQVAAMRKILEDALAQRHMVIDGDCWYTCPAATEERDGGSTCDETAGSTCGCGRDARLQRTVAALAEGCGIEGRTVIRYRTTCYGKPIADYETEADAKAALTEHIQQSCPSGSMPWANPIKWHRIDATHPVTGEAMTPGWVTAARGEYVDHHIDEVEA